MGLVSEPVSTKDEWMNGSGLRSRGPNVHLHLIINLRRPKFLFSSRFSSRTRNRRIWTRKLRTDRCYARVGSRTERSMQEDCMDSIEGVRSISKVFITAITFPRFNLALARNIEVYTSFLINA